MAGQDPQQYEFSWSVYCSKSFPIHPVCAVWQKTGFPAFEIVVELYNLHAS
jgi:hypothetical protein